MTRKRSPAPMRIGSRGSRLNSEPASTATALWMTKAAAAPSKTGSGRWRVASKRAASAVFSETELVRQDGERLHQLISDHLRYTGSQRAKMILDRWAEYLAELTPLLRDAYPTRPDGTTWFDFRRVFVVARTP